MTHALCTTDMRAGELRTWADYTGERQVTGELLGVEQGVAALKVANDRTLRIPLERLSAKDQRLAQGFDVQVVKLTISNFPELEGDDRIADSEGSAHLKTGVRITLLVRSSSYQMIRLRKNEFSWSLSTAKSGRDMIQSGFSENSEHLDATASENKTSMLINLYTPVLPQFEAGENSFALNCRLALECGRQRVQRLPDVRFAAGGQIQAGPISLRIEQVSSRAGGFGAALAEEIVESDSPGELRLRSDVPVDALQSIKIYDASEAEVTGGVNTTMKYSNGSAVIHLGVTRLIDSGTVEVSYVDTPTLILLPINCEVDCSLNVQERFDVKREQ